MPEPSIIGKYKIEGRLGQGGAQVFTTPKGGAEDVTFEQVGGATFTVRPSSVSGDVGPGVKPGTGKRIVWESGRDVERLEIDQFRFRISAQAGPLEMQNSDPPDTTAPTPGNPMNVLWTFGDGTTSTAPLTNGRAVTEKSFAAAGLLVRQQ